MLKVMAFLVKRPGISSELEFADAGAYQAWVAVMYAPGSGVADDEAKFLDRSKTRSYTVTERTS